MAGFWLFLAAVQAIIGVLLHPGWLAVSAISVLAAVMWFRRGRRHHRARVAKDA